MLLVHVAVPAPMSNLSGESCLVELSQVSGPRLSPLILTLPPFLEERAWDRG